MSTFDDHESRPRIKRSVQQIQLPGGDLILMRAHREDVRVREVDRPGLELLGALDGSRSLLELVRSFGEGMVRETIAAMSGHGLIEDARDDRLLSAEVRDRFDRQLRYFAEVGRPDGPTPSECQARLGAAKVAVLGTGGLGGRVAIDLASIGVGELWLADGDRVETSNLARQIQYDEADVGLLKVERLAARIGGQNPTTRLRTKADLLVEEEEIAAFVSGADLLVDAADWPPHQIERRTNAVCFRLGIPYIAMSHVPPTARVGPLYVPGLTGCYACQEADWRRTHPLYDIVAEQRSRRPGAGATLGPACGLTAGWVATEMMHFLTGLVEPHTVGAAYTLDLVSARIKRHEVVARPGCRVCAEASARSAA